MKEYYTEWNIYYSREMLSQTALKHIKSTDCCVWCSSIFLLWSTGKVCPLGPCHTIVLLVFKGHCVYNLHLHLFTKAVLLLAAGLTVDDQVRHLHGNLCLLLYFLLLSDLRLYRKTATSCLQSYADRPPVKHYVVMIQFWLLWLALTPTHLLWYAFRY